MLRTVELGLMAMGASAVLASFLTGTVTYELDNGRLATVEGDRRECEKHRDVIEADDGRMVFVRAPWGEQHRVLHVWCR